jgi:hypothetical protein
MSDGTLKYYEPVQLRFDAGTLNVLADATELAEFVKTLIAFGEPALLESILGSTVQG